MNIALVDLSKQRSNLFPLSYTRPIADLRVGILTIREKWERHFTHKISFLTTPLLGKKFSPETITYDLVINGSLCPKADLVHEITCLKDGESLFKEDVFIAAKGNFDNIADLEAITTGKSYSKEITHINRTWDIFLKNAQEIELDYQLLTEGRKSAPIIDKHTIVYGKENIFIEEGVTIKAAVLNAENGPIYIAKNAEIQEGSAIRGPFALGEGSKINMGAKMRAGTTIGPQCKVGGEVSNAVIWGNSNKGHEGFLGNAVLGEWCNLGADTNNSNLKNNYAQVSMWDEASKDFVDTGLQFCGLVMGDHSKSAINTMFNTGTTVGVFSNVYGAGFPKTRIPSFTWGGVRSMLLYNFEKAIETGEIVMKRKGQELTVIDVEILKAIYEETEANKL